MRDKAFKIVKNPKYDRYQRGSASMIYTFFDEKTSGQTDKSEIISSKESVEDLCKPIIKKFGKRKVRSSFTDNIWGADLADMQLINKVNKGTFFDYVLLIFIANMRGNTFQ